MVGRKALNLETGVRPSVCQPIMSDITIKSSTDTLRNPKCYRLIVQVKDEVYSVEATIHTKDKIRSAKFDDSKFVLALRECDIPEVKSFINRILNWY